MKGCETSTWGGLLAPEGTPKDVAAKLNTEANKALASADARDKLITAGIEPVGAKSAQFNSYIQSEMAGEPRWRRPLACSSNDDAEALEHGAPAV